MIDELTRPWTLTPDAFGRVYAPLRFPESQQFGYPFTDRYPTRAEAVAAGHRQLVKKAFEAGHDIPATVLALYPELETQRTVADLCPPAPNAANALPRLAATLRDVQDTQEVQTQRLALALTQAHTHQESLQSRWDQVTAAQQALEERAAATNAAFAKALAQQETALQSLIHTWREDRADETERTHSLHRGLAKALAQQETALLEMTAAARDAAIQQEQTLKAGQDQITTLLQQIAAALNRPPAPPAPPAAWRFQVRRDAQGFIDSIDATRQP